MALDLSPIRIRNKEGYPGDSIASQLTGTANGNSTYSIVSEEYNGDDTFTVNVRQVKFGNDGEASTLSSTVTATGLAASVPCRTKTLSVPLPYEVCNPDWDIELI